MSIVTPEVRADTTPILHHYAGSPFAEKVRLMLGFKAIAWRSVTVPSVMPKPDLVALTGGYRRTPNLQIGADVYCDTALIARVLERLQPTPSLFPPSAPLAPLLAQWADGTLFWTVIPFTLRPETLAQVMAGQTPESIKAFGADRAAMTAGFRRMSTHDAVALLPGHLAALAGALADGRPWLFGDHASIADFAVAHCLWFIRRAPLLSVFDPHPLLKAWLERVLAIGHGVHEEMDAPQALTIAAAARSHEPAVVQPGLGWQAGQAVTVAATDYATDAVAGALVGLSADEVVLRRHDDRAGTVHVHFPRQGFQIKEQAT
jgi:glutathione S-transferase